MAEPRNAFTSLRQKARQAARDAGESCDLCGELLPVEHRHLFNGSTRDVLCICRACTLLFDRTEAGGGVRRLIPPACVYLSGFEMTDRQWESLRIPVQMAFFTNSTAAERVQAMYPGPMGLTESLLTLETWTELVEQNPVLAEMEPDVQALLVNRVREARDYFLVPIDECYKLAGLIRSSWRGLSGGQEAWRQINGFFADLKFRSGGGHHA